ncbi:MAG: helix-turn-helix domain-containing protein [Deltaproteobacteria bacterium]
MRSRTELAPRWLGANVRHEREARGWSQEELAANAGLHPSCIHRIERGETDSGVRTLAALLLAFGFPLGRLLERREPRARPPGNPKQRAARERRRALP